MMGEEANVNMVDTNCPLFLCMGKAHFPVTVEAQVLMVSKLLASDCLDRDRVAEQILVYQISPDTLKNGLEYLVF